MSCPTVRVAVLTIGDELLSGEVQDTNLQSIASAVRELGQQVARHVCVPDGVEEISREVAALASTYDAVIVTGGLGPTSDDLTGESVARAAGVELVFHPHLEMNLRDFFKRMGRDMAPENLKQAYLPAGSIEIPTAGTAPGFMLDISKALVAVLPGVPFEMQSMLRDHVVPELAKRFAAKEVYVTRRVMTFGMGESDIAALLADLIDKGPVKYGFLVMGGPIVIKLTACGAVRSEAEALLDAEQSKVAEKVGSLMYAVDDKPLEDVVGEMLRDTKQDVATAESVTAGMVSARLANTPGSSDYFLGGVTAYSLEEKKKLLGVPAELLADGAVSRKVAEAMARGARELFGSDLGISTTGIAGPGTGEERKPVGTVAIALAHPGGVVSLERRLPGGRAMVRNIATMAALNMLRLYLMGDSRSSEPRDEGTPDTFR
jgi:nicotinamide-nucleotide amidase